MDDIRLKPYKKDFTYSYTLGAFPSIELLKYYPSSVFRVILSEKAKGTKGADILKALAEENNIPVIADDKILNRVSSKESVHALCAFNKYTSGIEKDTNHVVLVNPADMGNLGTIIRTLTAFGINDLAIILPAADIYDPKVIRASMGALFHIRFSYFNSFEEYLKTVSGKRRIYPFMLGGNNIENAGMPVENECFSLIFGNESRGLPDDFFHYGEPVEIEHLKTVDSLNLTIAVGIGVYHFTKNEGEIL